MQLKQALNVQRGDVVAFTGAGGKTSAMFRLGGELAAAGWRVIATTTTRIATSELALAPHILEVGESLRQADISRALGEYGFVFIYDSIRGNKVIGISAEAISALSDSVDSDVILVEADGSRQLPFKAPFDHEPVIPTEVSLVVPVVGFDVVGQPFDDEHVYNPGAMSERYGFPENATVRAPWLASVVRDKRLGLKDVPDPARVIALMNKVPLDGIRRVRAQVTARLMLREPRIEAVALGRVQDNSPVLELQRRIAAVVLAGGLSSRMGQSKVLLPWGERTVIQTIVDRLKRMHLDDIVVVTGHLADRVRAALLNEPVRCAHNPDYREGDMLSSLQTGLRALGPEIAACLVVLGDQPQIDGRVVSQITGAYAAGKGTIVAPSYHNRRGHPILIDRLYWPELLNLGRGGAPRDVINEHRDAIAYVELETDSILRDIDTPEDYEQERKRAGLG